MKTVLLFLFCTTLSFAASAHDFFFAFAEIEYNTTKALFEVTLEATAHDVVKSLQHEDIAITDLSRHYNDTAMRQRLEQSINAHLSLSTNGSTSRFHLDGYEVLPNGIVLFYLSSEKQILGKEITCRFDWLMLDFPEQQNKITLTIDHKKYTAVFLQQHPVAVINTSEE